MQPRLDGDASAKVEQQLDPTLLAGAATAREQERIPVEGTALCLSGGGYRAMVFHLGILWRLNDLGMLRGLSRVSSVSGGSIAAGVLGSRWRELDFDGATNVARAFTDKIAGPIHDLASTTIDVGAVLTGMLLPGTRISDRIESAYRKHLFGDRTLQDLPSDDEGPRFVINATSLQTGAVFRFSRPYMADYHVGKFLAPKVSLARAVAASSAFPPFLSPVVLPLSGESYEDGSGDAAYADYRREAVLSDGGVYDNLGLETAWKRFKTVLVSDGGAALKTEIHPAVDWALGAIRVLGIIDNQVRALRTRMTVDAFRSGVRKGTYFGIGTDIADYHLPDAIAVPHERSLALASVATRLAAMPRELQERLVNWGYAVCDAAIRTFVRPGAQKPVKLPYSREI
jgi:NTE family protein